MMNFGTRKNIKALLAGAATLSLLTLTTPSHGATIVTTGQTVGGTTSDLTLAVSQVTASNSMDSNDGSGNLVLNYITAAGDDFFVIWSGLSLSSASYSYVQVDFASVSAGAVSGNWSVAWTDDNNANFGTSITGLGSVAPQPTPFSVVIDLTDNPLSGRVWGPGNITGFRLDMFETFNNNNDGKQFVISRVFLGSELVPEPSSQALFGSGRTVPNQTPSACVNHVSPSSGAAFRKGHGTFAKRAARDCPDAIR